MVRPVALILLIVGSLVLSPRVALADERKDRFVGTLILEDVEPSDGRKFRLGQDLTYIDPQGEYWLAKKGLVLDGASIPQALWSIIGSPYTGQYRRAAVIHDYYCTNLYRSWQSVHRAFYDAMITDGVSKARASVMYYAVYRFGPRWTVKMQWTCPPGMNCLDNSVKRVDVTTSQAMASGLDDAALRSEFAAIERFILENNPSLDAIEEAASRRTPVPRDTSSKTLLDRDAELFAKSLSR